MLALIKSRKNTILIYEGDPTNKWQTVGELFVPGLATQSQDGLMSKEDKKKLDGLNNYTLPVANTTTLGGIKAKNGGPITIGGDGTIDIASEKLVGIGERDKLQKATTNERNITTLGGKVTGVETALNNTMTEEEAQAIINKYKGA